CAGAAANDVNQGMRVFWARARRPCARRGSPTPVPDRGRPSPDRPATAAAHVRRACNVAVARSLGPSRWIRGLSYAKRRPKLFTSHALGSAANSICLIIRQVLYSASDLETEARVSI